MDIFLRDSNATVSRHRRDFEHVEIETGDGFDGENVEIRTDPNGFTYEYEYYEDDESDGEEQFIISFTKNKYFEIDMSLKKIEEK